MRLQDRTRKYRLEIEKELKNFINRVDGSRYRHLYAMMAYHLGWEGEGAGPNATGKRIRPTLVLLTTEAAGGRWKSALPAAVSVELIHNFSLLHDDIEDNSSLRRGRPTVWVKWGVPQAINTGDSMFSLAHLAMLGLANTTSPFVAFRAIQILEEICLDLTKGQFLDIAYENQRDLKIEDYWPMVTGKTGVLLAGCTELGALIAGVDEESQFHYRSFGLNLGLAFQALDDLLGIWGDSGKIGKSIASDLITGKKSLPVLYGLEKNGKFSKRWKEGPISPEDVQATADLLEAEGARTYTQEIADHYTKNALGELKKANPIGDAGAALRLLANQLLRREV
jgi:geranylgeranyl diphosphate synthase type I